MNNELPKGWKLCDPDCFQCCFKCGDYYYRYVEIREEPNKNGKAMYNVCTTDIDLSDYSNEEIQEYVSGYYKNIEEVIKEYGEDNAPMIEAECIFEQLPDYEMDNIMDRVSLKYQGAVKRVKAFMEGYSHFMNC